MREVVTGKVYNNYTVISTNTKVGEKDSHIKYEVMCNCGKVVFVRADHLENGRSKCCKQCSSKKTYNEAKDAGKFGFIPKGHKGVGDITRVVYTHIKVGAKKRALEWDLSIEFLWDLFLKQGRKCALTGLDIWFTDKRKSTNINWGLMNASLDRKNSLKGYTKDNVQWVHKEYNRFKNNYSMDKFLEMCRMITEFNERS